MRTVRAVGHGFLHNAPGSSSGGEGSGGGVQHANDSRLLPLDWIRGRKRRDRICKNRAGAGRGGGLRSGGSIRAGRGPYANLAGSRRGGRRRGSGCK